MIGLPLVDHALFSRVLSDLAHTLVGDYEVGDVLYQLSDRTVEVLGISGAGVSLEGEDGRLRFVSATDDVVSSVERVQEELQQGPCHDSHRQGVPVLVGDVEAGCAWTEYCDEARRSGLRAVAGIPMRLEPQRLGAIDLYDARPREWSGDDVAAAQTLADMATSLVLNARQQAHSRLVAEQLQRALDSRVVIEQAKGIIANHRRSSVEEAFQRLRNHARRHNEKLHDVARQVVEGDLRP